MDDIITALERDILSATKIIWQCLKVAIEPSAGAGVAGVAVSFSKEFKDKSRTSIQMPRMLVSFCAGATLTF